MTLVPILKSVIGFILGALTCGGLTALCAYLYYSRNPIDAGQLSGFTWAILVVLGLFILVIVLAIIGGIAGGILIRKIW